MVKDFLLFSNCFKEVKGIRVPNITKIGVAILLLISILSFIAFPIGTVNASTLTSDNIVNDSTYNIFGDLNYDKTVDSLDFAKMKMSLLGTTPTIYTTAADLNGDGQIDSVDLANMKLFLLGTIVKFPVAESYTRSGCVIDVDLNDTFKVTLEDTVSAYTWSYTVSDKDAIILNSEEIFHNYAPDLIGAPAQKICTFKALKPGKYTLTYNLCPIGTPNIDPIETVQCNIYVTTTAGTIINVKENEIFKVSLKEGGIAGYTWTYTASDKTAISLVSEQGFYQYPGWFDAFTQVEWSFVALKPGKYTLLFTERQGYTVECEINVQ